MRPACVGLVGIGVLVVAGTAHHEIGLALAIAGLVWEWVAELWGDWRDMQERRQRSRARWTDEDGGPP